MFISVFNVTQTRETRHDKTEFKIRISFEMA